MSLDRGKIVLFKGVEQCTVSFSGEEFARTKRFVERRGRDAAQVTVTPVDTVQYCSPRSPISRPSSDVCVCMKRNEEGRVDSERDQLEPPSARMGFEAPGRLQCHPNWETGRSTAAGCLTAGVGSNLEGTTFSPTERVIGTRADSAATTLDSSKTAFPQTRRKPNKKTSSEENKQFDPGGKEEGSPPWKAAVVVVFSFLEGT